jgi:hypothetical protein
LEEKYNGYFSSGFLKIVYKENFKRKGRGRRGNVVSLQKLFTKRTSKEKEGVVGET